MQNLDEIKKRWVCFKWGEIDDEQNKELVD